MTSCLLIPTHFEGPLVSHGLRDINHILYQIVWNLIDIAQVTLKVGQEEQKERFVLRIL